MSILFINKKIILKRIWTCPKPLIWKLNNTQIWVSSTHRQQQKAIWRTAVPSLRLKIQKLVITCSNCFRNDSNCLDSAIVGDSAPAPLLLVFFSNLFWLWHCSKCFLMYGIIFTTNCTALWARARFLMVMVFNPDTLMAPAPMNWKFYLIIDYLS